MPAINRVQAFTDSFASSISASYDNGPGDWSTINWSSSGVLRPSAVGAGATIVRNTGTGRVFYGDYGGESGEHSHPYEYRIWAYDANDLLKVKAGTLQQHQLKPYGVWKLTFPSMPTSNDTRIDWLVSGVAYDPAAKRIYVRRVGVKIEGDWRQLIDVFELR